MNCSSGKSTGRGMGRGRDRMSHLGCSLDIRCVLWCNPDFSFRSANLYLRDILSTSGTSWVSRRYVSYIVWWFPTRNKNFHHWAAPNKSWYLSNSPPPPPPPRCTSDEPPPPPIHWASSNAVSTRNLLNKHYVGLFFPCSEAPCSFHEALFFNCDLLRCKWLFIVISVGTCNFCLVWQRSHRFKLQVRIPFRLLK